MALGITTFMGTSAALATNVEVSGEVGCSETTSTVTAAGVEMGRLAKNTTRRLDLAPTITQGMDANCVEKVATVTAAISNFTGGASNGQPSNRRVVVSIPNNPIAGVFQLTAQVPAGAVSGVFGATVTLTLVGS